MKVFGFLLFASSLAAADAFAVVPKAASIASVASPLQLSMMSFNDDNNKDGDRKMSAKKTSAKPNAMMAVGSFLTAAFVALNVATVAMPLPAMASDSRIVGELKGSGLVFKDTLQIERFDDPKVKGVTLYISNFDRPITEKLSGKNFFNDPSYASVGCAKTGPIAIADNIGKGKGGEEVFEESKSLLFKTLRVQRIYDEEKNTVVYVSFNTRLDKNDDSNKARFKSSLCAVNLE